MNLEKFWRALGAREGMNTAGEILQIDGYIVGHLYEHGWLYSNPLSPIVSLEVLLDGLEGLDAAAFVCPCAGPRKGYNTVRGYDWETGLICWAFDRREAAIDAICVLAGIEQEG